MDLQDTMTEPTWRDVLDAMRVSLPDIDSDGVRVSTFTIEKNDISNMFEALRTGRGTKPGTYTRLRVDGRLWMSDTDAEQRDHRDFVYQVYSTRAERVLINGLGLGMVLSAVLAMPWVKHVDVVERDERVARLVGGHYALDPRVRIHTADAYEQARKWPPGTRWDAGWSDIWPDLCTDNLKDMARLNRSYGRRCTWHGCWGMGLLRRHRAADQRLGW